MNQLFSLKNLDMQLYKAFLLDTIKYYYNKIYYNLFTLLEIRDMCGTSNSFILYLKYILFQITSYIPFHIPFYNPLEFDFKTNYFVKLYNKNGEVKALCRNCSIKDLPNICETIGKEKYDMSHENKMITKITINNLDVTKLILNFHIGENDILTLKHVLECLCIEYSDLDNIQITYIDFENMSDNPEILLERNITEYLNKSLRELI